MPLDGGLTSKSASRQLWISFSGDVCLPASKDVQDACSNMHPMHATVRAAHPNPRNRSAAIIVGEFAPIATAPFVDARYGRQDTARTVSAMVSSQGALFY
jgi:uncharacterized iron-regulated protein